MTGPSFAPDRWRRIEELFDAAIDLPAAERAGFLRQSCGADEDLRLEIESLLAADDRESRVIAGIVDHATASLLEEDDDKPD
jgi:hypothetical protein